ncbi:hypothetical protein CU098_011999 [Rhizopus stolonifer]|uniref:Extended synaptotagmin-like protein n=1 Tax=Rhizopus stolonifer TaxID=4846 RepID=A0A367KSH4_RHIST|nr:hypothetical protein CU098_011999 [Rhizopus stolonifer]
MSEKESKELSQAVNTALKSENGAPVHVFSPDAPPEEKKAELMDHALTENKPQIPGGYVENPLLGLPDWVKAGWTRFSSLPNPGDEKVMQELAQSYSPDQINQLYHSTRASNGEYHHDLVAQFVSEKYFGEWFHNCGVVFIAIFFTYVLTVCRLGIMSCLIVGAFFATYYRTSIKRTRRNARDDMERQVALNKLESDAETAGWMNHFLDRFWLIFEPTLSAQIIGQVDAVLSENTPSFLDSIRLSSFTLGTKAPRVDSVKVYPGSAPDIVCMDWQFSFTPNDVLDLTARQVQSKVNPKIVLTIRVGKGMVGAGMPILLEDIAFKGNIRIKLKLFNEMPHVKTAEICFLEKPHFDYVLKPVGGETFGFDINNIPGLETFVKDQVHANLGPMMYAPNVFTLDVAAMMAGTDINAANGVLAVTIYAAHGLKPSDLFGSLDPYCIFRVGDIHDPEQARTKAIENNNNPQWNETHFILLNSLNDTLCFQIMDRNTGRNDSDVGVATLALKDVEENQNALEGLSLMVLRSGKPVGEIKADVHYFPVSKPEKNEQDGTIVPAVESNSGVMRFYIQDCQDIGGAVKQKKGGVPLVGGLPVVGKVPIIGQGSTSVNSYAILKVNGQEKLRTSTFKRSVNPRWNKFIEIFVADKTNTHLEIILMNAVDFGDDDRLGRWSSSLTDMENQLKDNNDWWNVQDGTGKIHLNMTWKPVLMTGYNAALTKGQYQHPIGVVRIQLNKATKLKNVEALTGGKSDPYVRVMSGLQSRAQTEAILDNLNPVWDTAVYVPIHSMREDLMLEVMDYNDIQKDKLLGMCDLFIKDLVEEKKTDDQVVYEPLPAVKRQVELMNNTRKPGRGQLDYEASFFPTLALAKQDTENEEAPIEYPKTDLHGELVRYTPDHKIDLLSYASGVLSVKIHDVDLPQKAKAVVELLVDSNDAQYRTTPVKGTHLTFDEFGDAFVKEMDFSRLIVRVRDAKDDYKDEGRIGFWTSTVQDIIQSMTEDEAQEYRLLDCQGGMIRLSFKFVPVVKFTLDPSESLENQGNLTVSLLSASGLKAADKSGTSDPFCVFTLNHQKVYKSQTYKKQLSPVFNKNEVFTVPVLARTKALFEVKIFDWDQIGQNELLAQGPIPIVSLESFTAQELEVPLEGGLIRLRLKWEPQLLARKREGTSLLGSTTKLLSTGTGLAGDVVGLGAGAGNKMIYGGTKVIGGGTKLVGGAIGGGVGALGRGFSKFHGKKGGEDHLDSEEQEQHAPSLLSSNESTTRPKSIFEDKDRVATIKVTVIEARNLKGMNRDKTSDPYCRVRLGKHSIHKTKHIKKNCNPQWQDSFTTKVFGTSVLDFLVRDHNTLSDSDIGEVTFNVSEHVDEGKPFDGWLPLTPHGHGEIHIQVQIV